MNRCPLLDIDMYDPGSDAEVRDFWQENVGGPVMFDTGIPEECWPCVGMARNLPDEAHIDISGPNVEPDTLSEEEAEDLDHMRESLGYHSTGLVVVNLVQRKLIEETGVEDGGGEPTWETRIATDFDCPNVAPNPVQQ